MCVCVMKTAILFQPEPKESFRVTKISGLKEMIHFVPTRQHLLLVVEYFFSSPSVQVLIDNFLYIIYCEQIVFM